jgi:hypothetical protein
MKDITSVERQDIDESSIAAVSQVPVKLAMLRSRQDAIIHPST